MSANAAMNLGDSLTHRSGETSETVDADSSMIRALASSVVRLAFPSASAWATMSHSERTSTYLCYMRWNEVATKTRCLL